MDARKIFSKIGWSYVFFLIAALFLQLLLVVTVSFFSPYLPEWAVGSDASLIYQQAAMYALGFPVFVFLMGRIPSCKMVTPKKMGAGRFMLVFIFCLGTTYIGNFVGSVLMGINGWLTGSESMNPLDSLMWDVSLWVIVLVTVIVAPIMEELMFRKFLLDRIVPYGQKTAVVLSGILFGLFHGNFYQFFYATTLGMIFAYVYTETGKIHYNIALHMVINLIGGVAAVVLERGLEQDLLIAYIGSIVFEVVFFISIIASILLFFIYVRKIPWFSGWEYPPKGRVHAVLTAPGMWGMLVICVLLFIFV